ncbi:MAG: Sensory box histidine kinase/response regulator [uncultured Sulfurovum sp.]|uniref:Sensory/regulatory protein RpfC n=1 Tax=uncultured Sulfurovum sp. TaxID=269237 RepID=A0A6S6SQK6_9BACT|nr:MAG: Sensory box histidine kinase/response regulator [uncultured Sulfurovum sp.]
MAKLNRFSATKMIVDTSKILIFTIYLVLMLGSSYVFYKSYMNYTTMTDKTQYNQIIAKLTTLEKHEKMFIVADIKSRQNEQATLMITSIIVLLLTLFIFSRRKYIYEYIKLENHNLHKLLEEIDQYPSEDKIVQFKSMLKNKNTAETYELMSEIIEELQENKEFADEANRTKSLFLANMSHEIRTPLNGIVGFTKFLNSTELNEEQHGFVKIIRKSSEDLLSIINDILDISKIENGHVELEEIFFNPMEEFENVIESYAANASKKDIDFSLWIDPIFSSLLLRSDPGKIKQVLINLISNAVKFTENKGTIDVIIKCENVKEENIRVKFMVKDTGVGISQDQEGKVFEAFTQADSTTSRKYGGTGLGLTISAGLVNALGGALKVDSIVGEGSAFHFILNIPMKQIERSNKLKAIKIALYAPAEVETKESSRYLEDYLGSFKHLSMIRFRSLDECMKADFSLFDALYLHYDKINQSELEKIATHHGIHADIVLVTKLNKRHLVQKVLTKFAQVIYEPISFSKVEKSFNHLTQPKEEQVLIGNKRKDKFSPNNRKSMELFSGIHALVVEDNPINQKMIQHTLKNLGISTECADNGKIGFEMYKEHHKSYDIVFMDIQMPVMNGIESTQSIIAYEESKDLKHTPIVAVTANALKGDREHFMSEGLDEYVSKPIDLEKFIKVLKMYFNVSTAKEDLPSVSKRDILLYKETAMEAKIISAILNRLDYSVDIVQNIDELKKVMDVNAYKCILLDKVDSKMEHLEVTKYLKSKQVPSLLFVDAETMVVPSDSENFTFISDKVTDYQSIKTKVDQMISLSKAS